MFLLTFVVSCSEQTIIKGQQPNVVDNGYDRLETEIELREKTAVKETHTPVPSTKEKPTETATANPALPETLKPGYKHFMLEEDFINNRCLPIRPEYYGNWTVGDGKYYYALHPAQQILYEYDVATGSESEISYTLFQDGFITNIEYHGEWLIYLDLQSSYATGHWKLIALRLSDKEMVVVKESHDEFLTVHNRYSAFYDNKVYQTEVVISDNAPKQYNRLIVFDLLTKQEEVLMDFEIEDTIYTIIGASNGYLVLDKTPVDVSVRSLANIVLVSLADMRFMPLALTAPVSAPSIDYPWVIWKNAYRNDFAKVGSIYNIETGQLNYLPVPGDKPLGHYFVGDEYIGWQLLLRDLQPLRMIALYSIDDNIFYIIGTEDENLYISSYEVYDGHIYWVVREDWESADLSSTICSAPVSEVISNATDITVAEPTPNPNW